MTDIYGGRVLAGEDSEEDEDDEEVSFQLNGFGSQSTPMAPHFAMPIVVNPAVEGKGKESKESDEENKDVNLKAEVELVKEEHEEEEAHNAGKIGKVKNPESELTQITEMEEKAYPLWKVNESLDGIGIMSDAFVDTVRPSFDATIHRIVELKESQQRLLKILMEQNAGIQSNKQIEDAAVVLDKLPFYVKKLQGIRLAMQEISASSEKMKRRAENLRIDAQSYAIKKETIRDNQTQWNKVHATKSSEAAD